MATALDISPSDTDANAARRGATYRPLLLTATAMGLGVAADGVLAKVVEINLFGWWWTAAAAALALSWAARRRQRMAAGALLTLTAASAVGGAWEHWRWNFAAGDDLGLFAREESQPACVEVVLADRVKIAAPPERNPLRAIPGRMFSEMTVRVTAIRDGAEWRPASGWSRLRVAGDLAGAAVGDRVRVFGRLGRQPPLLNPGQHDWAAVERRAGRFCELYCDDPQCVTTTSRGAAWTPLRVIHAVRSWCSEQLALSTGPRHAPIALATLLGDQELLSDSVKDAFLKTGSIHLLVISGAHVAMAGGLVWAAVRAVGWGARMQRAATLIAVLLYAAVAGFEPSVTRATILTIAVLVALEAGRRSSAGNLLGAAALVVLAINPNELFRSGTQFSFLAAAALVAFGRWAVRPRPVDPLRRLIAETRPWPVRLARRGIGSLAVMAIVSLAVGIAVAPLVAYHFHVLTPASILLTPLASPLVGAAIAAGLASMTVGWLLPPLASLLGGICGGGLAATEWLVAQVQDLPGAYAYCASPGAWWSCGLYGAAGLMWAAPALRPRWPWLASLGMLWAAAGYASLESSRPAPGELRCTFLAVGHGTCAVLELPGRQTILYDAGSLGSPEIATQIISSYLWERGIDRIDALVLSHADIDHYNAVPGLVERFPVGVVYISPMMFDPLVTMGRLAAPNYLRDVLQAHGIPMREVWMNDQLTTTDSNVRIRVLHPPEDGVPGRDNANSLLVDVEYAGRRILLPGDLESPGIERVMADPPLDCDVLLAPHHGSEQSDPEGFAAWSTPEWVVMSGDHPARTLESELSYQQAGAAVLHTALDGAVTCVLSGGPIDVVGFRSR